MSAAVRVLCLEFKARLMDEQFLIRKLVTTCHLSVPERRALPDKLIPVGALCQAIVSELARHGWFPRTWRPNQQFDGGVIELLHGGHCLIHWKGEVSVGRVELIAVDHYESADDASRGWLHRMFPDDIDGIGLDWSA